MGEQIGLQGGEGGRRLDRGECQKALVIGHRQRQVKGLTRGAEGFGGGDDAGDVNALGGMKRRP